MPGVILGSNVVGDRVSRARRTADGATGAMDTKADDPATSKCARHRNRMGVV